MSYSCMKQDWFEEGAYSLVPLRKCDMRLIKAWRNAQMDVLRQSRPLTDADQESYYRDVIAPCFVSSTPRHVLFSYLREGVCIGYGGMTPVDWPSLRAEVSFLLDPVRAVDAEVYTEDFMVFLRLLKQAAFEDIGMHRLFTETFDIRPLHISLLEQSGFEREGRMKEHVRINGSWVDSLVHGCVQVR